MAYTNLKPNWDYNSETYKNMMADTRRTLKECPELRDVLAFSHLKLESNMNSMHCTIAEYCF